MANETLNRSMLMILNFYRATFRILDEEQKIIRDWFDLSACSTEVIMARERNIHIFQTR